MEFFADLIDAGCGRNATDFTASALERKQMVTMNNIFVFLQINMKEASTMSSKPLE